jgi:hypothetical protein
VPIVDVRHETEDGGQKMLAERLLETLGRLHPDFVGQHSAATGEEIKGHVRRREPLPVGIGEFVEKERKPHHDDDQQAEIRRQQPSCPGDGATPFALVGSRSSRMEAIIDSLGMKSFASPPARPAAG